jgi:hypothetical protein
MKANVSKRKQEAAKRTGQSVDQIHSVKVQLDVLRNQGILIDLNIRGVSMFTRAATWAEIGIQGDSTDPRFSRFTKGQKNLIPESEIRALKSIVTRMRYWLDKLSFDVTGFRPYRWLPYTAYQRWQNQWCELWQEFYAIKKRILRDLESHQEWLIKGYAEVAESSWNSIRANGYEHVILDGKAMDHDSFVDFVVASVSAKFPAPEQIKTNLHADYVTALVYGDRDAAQDQAQAEEIREKAALKREQLSLHQSAKAEQARHESMMHQLTEQERRTKIDAMLEAEARHAREQLHALASPFEEVFSALRKQMSDDAAEMLTSIRNNGFVHGKVAEKGRGLIEMFNLLAVQNDHELRGRLDALKAALVPIADRTDAPERSADDVKAILEQIMELEHSAAQDLIEGPTRFSMVEV